MSKKIFFWSPMLGNVGTIKATTNSIEALLDNSDHKLFILNVFGEFSFYNLENKNFKKLNIFPFLSFLPKTGYFSKFCIYFFSFLSFPYLFYYVYKIRPQIIYSSLVGYIPLVLKIFFKDLKVFNSIQGYPRFNYLRKKIWKYLYIKSDLIITMTDNTAQKLKNNFSEFKEIKQICNPVIDTKVFNQSSEKINSKYTYIFLKKFCFISIGRLTRQKNFSELLKAFVKLREKLGSKYFDKNISLLILGSGEDEKNLKKYIFKNELNNIHFLGFQNNPFNFLKSSNFYISTSLWEDPGHTLIEAASLKIPIISSDCPSGPREFFNSNNSFVYKSGNVDMLTEILLSLTSEENYNSLNLNSKIENAQKLSSKFSKKEYYLSLKDHL